MAAIEAAGFSSALAVPLLAQDRPIGMLTCYANGSRSTLDEDDLQLASVLSSSAAMAYGSAAAWRRLEELNRSLESQVAERTRELRGSLTEVERLARETADQNRLIETAYRELSELDRVKNELITRVSHELRNPAVSLQTAARILEQNQDGPPERSARFVRRDPGRGLEAGGPG